MISHLRNGAVLTALGMVMLMALLALGGCASDGLEGASEGQAELEALDMGVNDAPEPEPTEEELAALAEEQRQSTIAEAYAKLNITQDVRASFDHGPKDAEFQKYIVLHDTEGDASAASVVDWWEANGNLVAAHFVINKDGSIVQCVDLDSIAHHVGFGDAGHNALFGVEDESRDDRLGTTPIGSWAPDYGMNSYSVGIELVHVGGSGSYPEAQLEALDDLIAYIDAYYGFESTIIDHKAWRTGNSDTSPEFDDHLASYIATRVHA